METNQKNLGIIAFGIIISIAFIIATFMLSNSFVKMKSNQAITVKGLAEKEIISDLGNWSSTITVRDINPTLAYDQLQKSIKKVVDYLIKKGIKRESIAVSAIQTTKEYKLTPNGYRTNELNGYILSSNINIESNDVNLIENIYSESTTLIKDGVDITSNPPQYFYTKINDLKIEILGEAAKDAKMRAEQLAKSTGSTIGTIKSASQGVFQITEPNSTQVSDYGENNTTSIKKSVKAVVTIEFFVN